MTDMTFDTLEFSKTLKQSGFSEEQSEGVTKAMTAILKKDENLVTNDHLDEQLSIVKKDLEVQLALIRKDIEVCKAELKSELLRWMLGLMFAQTAIILAVVKFL